MKNLSSIFFVFLFAFSLVSTVYSQTTSSLGTFNIQGVVRNSKGGAVNDGNYFFTFKLYSKSGEIYTKVWEAVNPSIQVVNGVYSAEIGPFDGISFNQQYHLGVTFGNDAEMEPKIPLTSTPYALSLIGKDNIFPNSGNVGVGTSTPSTKLDVAGQIKIQDHITYNSENAVLNFGTNSTGSLFIRALTGGLGDTESFSETFQISKNAVTSYTPFYATKGIDAKTQLIEAGSIITTGSLSGGSITLGNSGSTVTVSAASSSLNVSGGVTTSGSLKASNGYAAGNVQEGMKIISGVINLNATKKSGVGFTVVRQVGEPIGRYHITFDSGYFTEAPAFVATVIETDPLAARRTSLPSLNFHSKESVIISWYNTDSNRTLNDVVFSFIAMGK
ncbi:MAG: hypothetical protein K9G44_05665 [Melioribacteraceae bacterium]|nr:hypothetical protein [Melioribacteraceae bacterium]